MIKYNGLEVVIYKMEVLLYWKNILHLLIMKSVNENTYKNRDLHEYVVVNSNSFLYLFFA